MDRAGKKFTMVWRVGGLNQKLGEGEHRIESTHLHNAKKFARDKGYRCQGKVEGKGMKYDHCSIHGLCMFINEDTKTVMVEGYSQSVLSGVGDEFGFPLY